MSTATQTQTPVAATQAEQGSLPVRRHETWSLGDAAHQGDLILICIGVLPASAKARKNRQLAEGETRGSRHIAVGGEVYDADGAEVVRAVRDATKGRVNAEARYAGPIFVGPCTVEHPEHQHQAFPESTVTAVIFQRNQDADEQDRRAQD